MKTRSVMPTILFGCLLAAQAPAGEPTSRSAVRVPGRIELPAVARDALANANYRQGMLALQTRCSACHSLVDWPRP